MSDARAPNAEFLSWLNILNDDPLASSKLESIEAYFDPTLLCKVVQSMWDNLLCGVLLWLED